MKAMSSKKKINIISFLIVTVLCAAGCNNSTPAKKEVKKQVDYIKPIPGPSDTISVEIASKGEVLIGYSDCYTCHKKEERSAGPAFRDVAKRYPVNDAYIDYLAKKVIKGGSGSWGFPVMSPHPTLSLEDAKMMVTYILSLRKR